MTALHRALANADRLAPELLTALRHLVAIPSCSFPGFDHAQVERSAQATRDLFLACGWPSASIERLPGVLPYVVAEDRRAGPQAPTLVLYAHHDVQPPLREELWQSPPFSPVERDGRLYGRGAADDKAGVVIHAFAPKAWDGAPPVNLVAVIEGEEEIGSQHFAQFLATQRERLRGEVLVIADLANVDTGVPSLTTSLRGMTVIEVELRALRAPLHSGMWGGTVPDVCQRLVRLLHTLTDDHGRVCVPGFHDDVQPPSPAELASWAQLPYLPARFAEQAGLLRAVPEADPVALHRRLWAEPSLAITSIQAGVRGQTGNVLMDAAWARLAVRLAPGQDPQRCTALLSAHLRAHAAPDCELTLTPRGAGAPAWRTATDHPAFAAAQAALSLGFGRAPLLIGCGASIPFVAEATAQLGGIPALLLGVEDPTCAAHAENESLHLADFHKAFRSEVALFSECAARLRPI